MKKKSDAWCQALKGFQGRRGRGWCPSSAAVSCKGLVVLGSTLARRDGIWTLVRNKKRSRYLYSKISRPISGTMFGSKNTSNAFMSTPFSQHPPLYPRDVSSCSVFRWTSQVPKLRGRKSGHCRGPSQPSLELLSGLVLPSFPVHQVWAPYCGNVCTRRTALRCGETAKVPQERSMA